MKTITINVSPGIADLYEKVDDGEKNRIELYINAWLNNLFSSRSANERLTDVMKKASREAKKNGFEPKMLGELLKDDE